MNDIWKKIKGFPKYEINQKGVVRSWFLNEKGNINRKRPFRILTHTKNSGGYLTVGLSPYPNKVLTRAVHRILCLAHKGKPKKGEQVWFKDFDKENIELDNLVYDVRKGRSMSPNRKSGTKGEKCHMAKLKDKDIPFIRRLLAEDIAKAAIGRAYDVSSMTIVRIDSGDTWSHVA